VALHPQFATNRRVYWTYAQRDERGRNGTELARGVLEGAPGAYRMTGVQTRCSSSNPRTTPACTSVRASCSTAPGSCT
jgi:glucose/arabinose dehydrogenase